MLPIKVLDAKLIEGGETSHQKLRLCAVHTSSYCMGIKITESRYAVIYTTDEVRILS
jgi:hypothetical protein